MIRKQTSCFRSPRERERWGVKGEREQEERAASAHGLSLKHEAILYNGKKASEGNEIIGVRESKFVFSAWKSEGGYRAREEKSI